jgi:hypothetical protein
MLVIRRKKMTNKKFLWGILALALMFGMTVVGCGEDSTDNSQTVSYEGSDISGNTYILTVTEKTGRAAYTPVQGDSYVLTIKKAGQPDKISRGTVMQISADGTFTLQPLVEGSDTFSVVISGAKISSVKGDIAIDGGEVITARSFGTIYLRANRYTFQGGSGEQWSTGPILLSDFFTGTLKTDDKIRISGLVDKKLEHAKIDVMRILSNREWEWIGSTSLGLFEITGSFNNSYSVRIDDNDVLIKDDGEIIVQLTNEIWYKNSSGVIERNFGTIPKNIPDGTIMATIRNFSMTITEEQ